MVDRAGPVLPSKVKSKCPAIIFAVNRIANVPGRIILLIVSIQTIKGIRTGGVPWGTKWANMWTVLLIHPNNINLNHKGKASDKVKVKCLVLEKIYGNKDKKLLNKINEKREIKINVLPFILFKFRRILNSLWRPLVIIIQPILFRDGINQ